LQVNRLLVKPGEVAMYRRGMPPNQSRYLRPRWLLIMAVAAGTLIQNLI
jgi:hypothetical protein